MTRAEYYSPAGVNKVWVDGWRVGLPLKEFVAATVIAVSGQSIRIAPDGAEAIWVRKFQVHRYKPEPTPGFFEPDYQEPLKDPKHDDLYHVFLN